MKKSQTGVIYPFKRFRTEENDEKVAKFDPRLAQIPFIDPKYICILQHVFLIFHRTQVWCLPIGSGDAGPPTSSAGRLPTQHFDIPGPDYITLSATINRGYAIRNVMIPILSQNLLDSEETEDLHRYGGIYLPTSELNACSSKTKS